MIVCDGCGVRASERRVGETRIQVSTKNELGKQLDVTRHLCSRCRVILCRHIGESISTGIREASSADDAALA